MDRLKGKVVIITGGASGIGRETAQIFAKEGGRIAIFDMNEAGLREVEDEIRATGGECIGYKVDVSDFESVNSAVQKVLNDFHTIDVLVNNAGITRDNFLVKMDIEDWNRVIAINLTGTFNCGKAVLPIMMEKMSGVVVNVSSVVGVYGNIGQSNYAASKAGVIGLTKTWAKEFGKKGIRVNAVAPGFIKTPMTEKVPDKVIEYMVSKTPMGRMGEAREVANAILFLASDEASFITGHILHVDGGLVI
ncbi:3-oxoacyl-[acyl-carrier-protein] reductase [Caldisericum sp. AR60]|uniref:3-oxoacyl-[acyl-carrier-protein] reductase n=2 Tax=unclassified Caldisericum TaxID=2641600 RepID=UPI0039FC7AC8